MTEHHGSNRRNARYHPVNEIEKARGRRDSRGVFSQQPSRSFGFTPGKSFSDEETSEGTLSFFPSRAHESWVESSLDSAFVRSSKLIRDILRRDGDSCRLSFLSFRRLTVPKLSSHGRIIRKLARSKILEGVARSVRLGEGKVFAVLESKVNCRFVLRPPPFGPVVARVIL